MDRNKLARQLAEYLLQIKAIKLNSASPFTWASGWKSPIYCNNRKILSYPKVSKFVQGGFADIIKEKYKDVDVVAGVATGGIAMGVLVAEILGLPFIYVSPSDKEQETQSLIEGKVNAGQKVVVIEDLVSTGGSSLKVVNTLREVGCEVLGLVAIFSYGFQVAKENFEKAQCELIALGGYNTLIEEAMKMGYVEENDLEHLKKWRLMPDNWTCEN